MVISASASPDGQGFRLRTDGLARRGLAELEMIHIPEARTEDAAGVLNTIADYLANQSRVEDAQRVAIMSPGGALVARLEPGPGVPAEGLWRRMFGKETRFQRVGEPMGSMEHPKTLLSSIMLWRARSLLEEDRIDDARRELLASIEWFPGDPARRSELFMGFPFNWENHLSYEALAQISAEEERESWLVKAFERSEELERLRLGDTMSELRAIGTEGLRARAREVLSENAATTGQMAVSSGVVMIVSPLRGRVESDDGVLAERRASIVPNMCAEYQAVVATDSEQHCQLVAQVVTQYVDSPARLALMTEEIRQLYEGGDNDKAPSQDAPRAYRVSDRLVSLLLADIVRRTYAGLSIPELHAVYGLSQDATARREAEAKMANLAGREGEACVSALSSSQQTGTEPERRPAETAAELTDLSLNEAGEAVFKVVAVSYHGSVDWVLRLHEMTREQFRGVLQPAVANEGWRVAVFDFLVSGITVRNHPIRIYIFAHEGIGFFGQSRRAKDSVYRNADVLLGLGGTDDLRDLVPVLQADLGRTRSTPDSAALVICAPLSADSQDSSNDAEVVQVDWHHQPLGPLKAVVKAILSRYS